MNRIKTLLCLFVLVLWCLSQGHSRCHQLDGVIFTTHTKWVSLIDIAIHGAPMLWFSPDEPGLYDSDGSIQFPKSMPYDDYSNQPIVYYKVKRVYGQKGKEHDTPINQNLDELLLDMTATKAIDLEYYFYYPSETGLGGHPHDLESVALQLQVVAERNCPDYTYAIQVKKVIARAHGLTWFENAFEVDDQTVFPLSILVEEGKHANCTDKNADGIYTPSFDVTEKVNDAWGVRDIISSGKLFSGGFQGWMAKQRTPSSLIFPPLPVTSPHYGAMIERFGIRPTREFYKLRPFPDNVERLEDKTLKKMVKSKKPNTWPRYKKVSGDGTILQWSSENKLHRKIGVAYRFDEDNGLSATFPLLIFRNVEAPMTGGWFYHKIYFGNGDSAPDQINRTFGHQIQHTNSASRWLDTYVGGGYEVLDMNNQLGIVENETFFVTEIGMKIRFNITKTPLKAFKWLGTDYWGLRLGWKNLGFNPFFYSGFIIEVGAGVF